MHTFHDEFEVKKLLGKGHFAKVLYILNNNIELVYYIEIINLILRYIMLFIEKKICYHLL